MSQAAHLNATPANILIVDDELGPRESLKMILNPPHKITIATNGAEAVEMFDPQRHELVISDIRMPRMNGIELMKTIKAKSPDTPFILLTGYAALETAQEAVRTGAFDYISKPYNVSDIRQVVAAALEDARQKKEEQGTVGQLNAMNDMLQQQILQLDQKATIGDLSAEMIHDLNNPICVLQGYISLLEDALASHGSSRFAGSEEEEFLGVIKEQINRCIRVTQNFLDYARHSKHKWDTDCINSLIQDTLFVLRVRMRSFSIELATDLEADLPKCLVQSTPLQQVFYNLITNAIQAMEDSPQPRRLEVTTRERINACGQAAVLISIKDTGPGIAPDIQEKIFTPFYTTKTKDKGTGLGLPICKRIVEEHAGSLEIKSGVGQGTEFLITIPLEPSLAQTDGSLITA